MSGFSSKIMDRIAQSLVVMLLPRVMDGLVQAVEELVKLDLNKDGVIGFGSDNGEAD